MGVIELRKRGYLADHPTDEVFGTDTDATVDMTITSLAAGQGWYSDVYDMGACRSWLLSFFVKLNWGSAPAVGEDVGLYLAKGTDLAGAWRDGSIGITDANFTDINTLLNFPEFVGPIFAQSTSTAVLSIRSLSWETYGRYIQLALWNRSAADALSGTAADNKITMRRHLLS